MQLFLGSTELKIRDHLLKSGSHDQMTKLKDLESTLVCIERWLSVASEMTMFDWVGISVDTFNQFMQCLIILFKLTTACEPLWNTDEVKKRADVFQILDYHCEIINQVTIEMRMVDAPGLRHGLFYKAPSLLQGVKALMRAEMTTGVSSSSNDDHPKPHGKEYDFTTFNGPDFVEDIFVNLDAEPWLTDLFEGTWNHGISSYDD